MERRPDRRARRRGRRSTAARRVLPTAETRHHMTAATTDPTVAPAPRRHRWVRIVLTVVVAAILAMWIYAFAFAPREGVNLVKDPPWVERAEATCAAYATKLEPLIF